MSFSKVMATSLAVVLAAGSQSSALTFVSDLDTTSIEQAYKTTTERIFLGDILDTTSIEQAYKTTTERIFLGDILVEQHLITNNMKKAKRKPTWIVIHDTANTSKTATSLAHINYYQTNKRGASAHYTVDDTRIVQTVADNDIAYHCGDKKNDKVNNKNSIGIETNKRGASAHYTVDDTRIVQTVADNDIAYHCGDKKNDKVNNKNSIGIEMCINQGGDFNKTVDSAVKLTQYLMDEYNIPKSRVIRHFDVTGKPCPGKFLNENPDGWKQFKDKLHDPKKEKENHPTKMTTSEECELVDSNKSVLAKLGMGVDVDIVEYGDTWCKVKCGEDVGFVGTKFLFSDTVSQNIKIDKITSMYSTTNVKSADITMLSKGASVGVGFVGTKFLFSDTVSQNIKIDKITSMYSTTNVKSADITMLSKGASVGLLKKNDTWCKVKCGKEIGYIETSRLM